MGIHSFESHNREQRRGHLRAVKRNLVFSVFKRIDEHLQENPHVDSFTTPLLVKEGIEATYVRALLRAVLSQLHGLFNHVLAAKYC